MCNNELARREDNAPVMSEEQMRFVSVMMQQMLAPVMENMGKILERNNQAMERIAATQQMMTTRISDLEKQVRLKTPLSRAQENYVNNAVRARARELLESRGYNDDKKAVTKLGGMIRNSDTLTRSGIPLLKDIPYLGYLFGSTVHRTERTELMILITVNVIDSENFQDELIRRYKASLEEIASHQSESY